MKRVSLSRLPVSILALMGVQAACAVFFISDAIEDFYETGSGSIDTHLVFEALATLGLLIALVLEARMVRRQMQRETNLKARLDNASAEVHAVIIDQFDAWSLSPAERDIAMFLVKGLSTQDIADLRGSAEGTVKAHFNAIFRKAGVHSRVELLSLLIDRLLGNRL